MVSTHLAVVDAHRSTSSGSVFDSPTEGFCGLHLFGPPKYSPKGWESSKKLHGVQNCCMLWKSKLYSLTQLRLFSLVKQWWFGPKPSNLWWARKPRDILDHPSRHVSLHWRGGRLWPSHSRSHVHPSFSKLPRPSHCPASHWATR